MTNFFNNLSLNPNSSYQFNILSLVLVSIVSTNFVIAQTKIKLTPKNSDCSGAIELIDSITTIINSPIGFGNIIEFSGNKKDDSLFVEKEHNTVWYYFKAKADGEFSFDIIPFSKNDDYDFMLFKFTDSDFCKDVISKKVLPIRTCISRNDQRIESKTGLIQNSKQEFINSGPGASYVKNVIAHKGELYFILVDNVYANGAGHTIKIHWNYHKLPMLLKVNESLAFENIEFEPGTDRFVSSSYFWLDSLKRIMIHHPTLEIEIQGHVDGFKRENDSTYQSMSEKRAKAVYDYLQKSNIAIERMSYKGFGNTMMKNRFPDFNPKLHRENRRVEIKIIKV